MSLRETVTALLETQPFRGLVVSLSRSCRGRRLLTALLPRRGIYESFQDALNAAARGRQPTHENREAVDLHARLASSLMGSDYAVLYWLTKIRGSIRLFDYGGNMGNVFYRYAPYVDTSSQPLQWTVYDFPQVIGMAKELAATRIAPNPRFTTSIQDAADMNVLLVSGAYHFWEGSARSFLEQFPRLPEHVFINRSPFYDDRAPVFSMKSEATFAVPMIIKSTRELIEDFTAKGYELVNRWIASEHSHIMPLFPDHSVKFYSGFYFCLTRED